MQNLSLSQPSLTYTPIYSNTLNVFLEIHANHKSYYNVIINTCIYSSVIHKLTMSSIDSVFIRDYLVATICNGSISEIFYKYSY